MEHTAILSQDLVKKVQQSFEGGRVVLFSAPCGFGKTTVAATLSAGKKVCRLPTEDGDYSMPLASRQWDVLVVDDLQELTQEQDQQALCALIREERHRKFLLLSRGILPSWLTPFHVAGILTVLTAQDLKLDRASTGLLLQQYGVTVHDAELTAIYQETKGYPLSVTLLARRMARGQIYNPVTSDEVRRDMFLYYEQVILNRWDRPTRQLLLELSLFQQVNGELARMVSGDNHAGERMGILLRDSSMLILDGLNSYHFWPLFRQFLIWELEQNYGEEHCRSLYNRGGLYYELNEDYGRALECYAKGKNYGKITQLLIRNAEIHPGMGYYQDMAPYYRALPQEEILSSPALMQAMSMMCALSMDYQGSQDWYEALQRFIRQGRSGDSRVREARGRLAWLDIALPQRKVEGATELFQTVFGLLSARKIQMPPFSVTSSLPSLMNGAKDFSPWSKQDDLLYATLRKLVEGGLGRDGVCLGDCAIAESKFEKGEDIRDRAMILLQNLERIRRDGTPDLEFAVIGLMARMQMDLGRPEAAKEALLNLRRHFVQAGHSRFLPNLDAMVCRVDLLLGDDTATGLWYRDKAPMDTQNINVLKRYLYFTLAMVQLSWGEEDQALATLAPLVTYCEACHRYIDKIHLHVLSAIARQRQGNQKWKEYLCTALDTACEFSFLRPVGQYGSAVLPLLQSCGWTGDPDFLAGVSGVARSQAAYYPDYLMPRVEMSAPLSGAERQVLHLLCAGKSNGEICALLGIKLATVKTHVSRILDKLNVKRRSEVKAAAQRLHLIE